MRTLGQDNGIIHAGCVAWQDRAVLIIGPSGSGKSALALQLMAYGCTLVSDDRSLLTVREDGVEVSSPPAIKGLIEARGVGILRCDTRDTARLSLVVDMEQTETDRLPPQRMISVAGVSLPLLHNSAQNHFPASVLQYLKSGRHA